MIATNLMGLSWSSSPAPAALTGAVGSGMPGAGSAMPGGEAGMVEVMVVVVLGFGVRQAGARGARGRAGGDAPGGESGEGREKQ